MTEKSFQKKLKEIEDEGKKYNAEVKITQLIDKDHLLCDWYGGNVGYIKFDDGYIVTIEARGDIELYGKINGEEIIIKDRNNSGRVYDELGYKLTDDTLVEALDYGSESGNWLKLADNTPAEALDCKSKGFNWLECLSNNWFEFNIITPDNKFIDMYYVDNIIDDNLLDCFLDIGCYRDMVQFVKDGNNDYKTGGDSMTSELENNILEDIDEEDFEDEDDFWEDDEEDEEDFEDEDDEEE